MYFGASYSHPVSCMNEEATITMSKVAVKQNNEYSVEVRLWFWHITWVHIYARFEDLLSMSTVIRETSFEQRRMLHHNFKPFVPQKKLSRYLGHMYTLYKKMQGVCW